MKRAKQPFTEADLERLFHARDVLRKTWGAIAGDLPGTRTASTCCWAYIYYSAKLRAELVRDGEVAPVEQAATARAGARILSKVAGPAPAPRPAADPEHRPRYFHHADADLRGRIDRQGITAGLLGDPPPGRSALDRMTGGKA